MGANFAWCADLQDGARQALYVDQVHYTADGNRLVADCIARTLLASGALERARQRTLQRIATGAAGVAAAATSEEAPAAVRVIAPLFSSHAVTGSLDMSMPLGTWGGMGAAGVRLADASAGFSGIYEDFPLDPASAARTYQMSVRIKPDSSDYVGLVLDCLSGSHPENYVLFVNPQTMGVIAASGLHDIVPEPNGWVRLTLAGACSDPAQDRLRVSLYPQHGAAEKQGAIIFGGGEFARLVGARLTSTAREPTP